MQNTDGLAARGSGLNGPCERRRGMGDHSVVPRKLRKWFGLWLARTCCQQATGCFPLDNPLREAQSMGVEGLRSGTKTLPWHKHPSVLDRVTLRVALSSFGLLLQSIANRDYGIEIRIWLSAAAFKHRLIVDQHPVVVPPLVGIADNHRRTRGTNHRIG